MKCLLKHVLIFVALWFAAMLTLDTSVYPPEPTSWIYWFVAVVFILWIISMLVELVRSIQELIRSILE